MKIVIVMYNFEKYWKNLFLLISKCLNFLVLLLKFIYSEKATIFCEISTLDLSYIITVKSTVEISQNFVAFSECMNFTFCEKKLF